MIRIENTVTPSPEQWMAVIAGARNPMNSWAKMDSQMRENASESPTSDVKPSKVFVLGENDKKLLRSLCEAGTSHRKFLRMLPVMMDVVAPLYWMKEFDTYKVGTVANSCSTMHKIHAKEFTLDDFSHEHLIGDWDGDAEDALGESIADVDGDVCSMNAMDLLQLTIRLLNAYRERFLETKDKRYWWQMIQLLPSSYNQHRTLALNYEVLLNIWDTRKGHKLDEWNILCDRIEELPYFREICLGK